MNKRLHYIPALLLTLLLGFASCSSGSGAGEEPEPAGETFVTLKLNLTANSGSRAPLPSSSRADEWYYEQPTDEYEKVKEMRVIIIRPDHNFEVEVNSRGTYDMVWETLGQEKFKVVGGEKKLIYLIGNESSLPQEIRNTLSSIKEGSFYSKGLADLTLSAYGSPFIDNSGSSKKYVPMTEFFEYQVPEGDPAGNTEITADFFVTRALTKFSFTAAAAEGSTHSKGIKITDISVTNLATMSYLFPRNAIYSPAKDMPVADPTGQAPSTQTPVVKGREIISFNVPVAATYYQYQFTPESFGLAGTSMTGLNPTYSTGLYFLESGRPEFAVSVTTEVDGITRTWSSKTLPNLPRLPRNTHVVVEFRLSDNELIAVVKLVPWIGVPLEYTFGFEDLIHWDRTPNGDVEDV